MSIKEFLSKYKVFIIIILLFLMVFSLRAEAGFIPGASDQMKAYYEDGNGLPYFSEMDSYYNYRMTADFIAYGHLGETKINGTDWDTLSYAPEGRSAEYSPLIVYLTAFVYKVANLFAKVPLTAVAFWMAAFIASLCVIPAYLFIRRLTNDYGGIVAALLVGLAPFYFSHTFAGFFDTDMFNILLPLLVAWFFVESVRAKEIKNRAIFAVLSAVSLLLFSMAWEGWWYIFYILIAAVVIYLPVSRYLFNIKTKPLSEYPNKKEWFLDQHEIFSLAVFLVLGSILIILVSGWSGFVGSLTGSVSITQLQSSVTAGTSYPNVFVSVGEMQVPTLDAAIAGVGGIAPVVFAILGVFLLFWQLKPKTEKKDNKPKKSGKKSSKRKNKSKRNRKAKENDGTKENENKINGPISGKDRKNYLFYGILFSLWLIIIAYALTKGQRFGEPFAIPVALSAGIFVGFVATYVKEHVANQGYRYIITALVVIIAVYSPIVSDYSVASSIVPGTDDSMVASLSWINQNTSNDTVITSWWDYGHLFTAVADRPVTFDGGSQTGARAYWVGKALLTNNETLSAGILKMLSTSGDQGYLTLENYTKDTGKSTEILNNILGVDKATAQTILTTQYGLTTDQAQNVLKYTHPDNPTPDVLITSSDMIGKALWWSYFGSWNFTSNNGTASGYSAAQANATTVNNTTVLIGSNAVVAQVNGSNITAGVINTNELQSQENTTSSSVLYNEILTELKGGNGSLVLKPHKLMVINNGNLTEQIVSNDSSFSILVIGENSTYITVAMSKELEDSMFTRLYFMGGAGLTHFNMSYAQPGVMVWKVS
ncbi:STT3 domain-containing protein [Methanobacterium paludis]|uniref:dolichyl-phosphooligosaccharide-protein glycotransferase n=1 Tax=Methanobacterium paludis (strain DSM 25820 / JCM 18151 / SWAN1) TaxID=868131 RepID=F6D5C5_METPW|nr:STT3 domain-containing protein [Methanobacterium paludis]AEG18866.1 Oligosaccharyl transferase STT3 subunit [Methanobacterium paludis]